MAEIIYIYVICEQNIWLFKVINILMTCKYASHSINNESYMCANDVSKYQPKTFSRVQSYSCTIHIQTTSAKLQISWKFITLLNLFLLLVTQILLAAPHFIHTYNKYCGILENYPYGTYKYTWWSGPLLCMACTSQL